MFLVDTNVLSELRRPDRCDANVRAWSLATPSDATFLSVITPFEIRVGVLAIERRDRDQAGHLRKWLERDLLPRFDGRILDVNLKVALQCAALHVPNPRPDRDAFIAATALVHGLTLVTRNEADFAPMGVPVLNPWRTGN